jgi:hypothetical protein
MNPDVSEAQSGIAENGSLAQHHLRDEFQCIIFHYKSRLRCGIRSATDAAYIRELLEDAKND